MDKITKKVHFNTTLFPTCKKDNNIANKIPIGKKCYSSDNIVTQNETKISNTTITVPTPSLLHSISSININH